MEFFVKPFEELSPTELYEILKTRSEIFVVEQKCVCQDMDDKDQKALHVFCCNDVGRVTGCLRVFWKDEANGIAQIGRVVTLEHGKGIGGELLHKGVEVAREQLKAKKVYLHSQQYAIGYYAKEGFRVVSDIFPEDGIPHVEMELNLVENIDEGVRKAFSEMAERIVSIMNGAVYGIWLYGSAVMEDFRLGWSDIDFVALTTAEISEKQADELLVLRRSMTEAEPDNPYYRSFEGIIANLQEYCDRTFRRLVYWGTSGQRVTDTVSRDAFSEYELAHCGVSMYGGKPWILPKPERSELIRAVQNHYETIRRYAVQTDERLYSCGWLLDIARCICTVRYDEVVSKTEAGNRALREHFFSDEEPMRRALEIRQQPLKYKDDPKVREWLSGLGQTVQRYADVLAEELTAAETKPLSKKYGDGK